HLARRERVVAYLEAGAAGCFHQDLERAGVVLAAPERDAATRERVGVGGAEVAVDAFQVLARDGGPERLERLLAIAGQQIEHAAQQGEQVFFRVPHRGLDAFAAEVVLHVGRQYRERTFALRGEELHQRNQRRALGLRHLRTPPVG